MYRIFTLMLIGFLTSSLYATEYVKLWINGEEGTSVTQGEQFAWEFDVSVNGGTGTFQLILDTDANGLFGENDVVLVEFEQTDGVEGNDGPGDSDGTENGVVYSELGPFGFAPGHYIFWVTDNNDESHAFVAFEVNALSSPVATISGNISKADITPPNNALANIMVNAQLDEGFAGFWTGLTNDQGNYTINLPDTAVGTLWNIELFSENDPKYIISDRYERVNIHAGANSGYNFQFSLPSSYVYGKLIDEQGEDVILNDYVQLTNIISNTDFTGEIIDGHYSIAVAFDQGQNSGQFKLSMWGQNLPPNYMIPQFWNNEAYTLSVNEGDSLEKNITLKQPDEEIYIKILKDGGPPEMVFEVHAYDEEGQTFTRTSTDGSGTLAVKGTGYYNINITFDKDDLEPLPPGYTFEGGTYTSAAAGDTAKFYIIGATSSISGSLTFAEGDEQVNYDINDFNLEIQEEKWPSSVKAEIDDSLNYHMDLADGTYSVRFYNHTDDFLPMPTSYENLVLDSDSLTDTDFELNYCHANIYVKFKNALSHYIDPTHYQWSINTKGEPPYFYQTWANGNQDSTFHFRVCEGEWVLEPPNTDTSFTMTVTPEGTNYYVEYDYITNELTTDIKDKPVQIANKFELLQNYPNPFNPSTTIKYQVEKYSRISLKIYDVVGREIATLLNEKQGPGEYSITYDASRLPSGVYFYRLVSSAGFTETRKMLLVK